MSKKQFEPTLFLDIDGVLVTHGDRAAGRWDYATPVAVAALNRILRETHASMILCSAWRHWGTAAFNGFMQRWGVAYGVSDCTGHLGSRAAEISEYGVVHGIPRGLCVWIDDVEPGVNGDGIMDLLVRTDAAVGLTDVHADEVIARCAAMGVYAT